MGM
jgi:hypothetical protein